MKRTTSMVVFLVLAGMTPLAIAQTTKDSTSYSFPDRGGVSVVTAAGSSDAIAGYARVQPGGGTTAPTGVALFAFRPNGVLITEAAVPATAPILSGRTYAELNGPVNTAFAFANPNAVTVTISFFFTDETGTTATQGNFTMDAGTQIARFINEAPFSVTSASGGRATSGSFTAGTFTFSATAPVGVISLRTFKNERGEFLAATQPIASATITNTPLLLAHFAEGGGWKTQVLLVNQTDAIISGNVQFFGEGSGVVAGTPVALTVNGQTGATFVYTLPARSSVNLATAGIDLLTTVGSVRVTPAAGSNTPFGFTVFSLTTTAGTVTQTSASSAPPSIAFRTYVELGGTVGTNDSLDSGIAIANTSTAATSVNLDLTTLAGVSTGQTALVTVPGSGHVSRFIHELFPNLNSPFRGVLRLTSQSPISVVSLRTRYNERGDFLITTTPVTDELSAPSTVETLLPHIVELGGYTTQIVLFSGTQSQSGVGTIRFFDQTGKALTLTYQ